MVEWLRLGPDCRRRSSEGSARKPPSRRVEDDRNRLGRHPKRTLYAGGGGLLSSLVSQAAPRLPTWRWSWSARPLQQKPGDAGDPTRRDNLYTSRTDALRGSQAKHLSDAVLP